MSKCYFFRGSMENLKYLNWCARDGFVMRYYKEIDRNLSDIYTDIIENEPSLLINQPMDENEKFMDNLFDGEPGDIRLRLLDIQSIKNNIIGVNPVHPVVITYEVSPTKTVTYSVWLKKKMTGDWFKVIIPPDEKQDLTQIVIPMALTKIPMRNLLELNARTFCRDDYDSENWINDNQPVVDYVSWHKCESRNIFIRKFTNLGQNLSDSKAFANVAFTTVTSLNELAMKILIQKDECINDMGLVQNNVAAIDFDTNSFITAYIKDNRKNLITFKRYEINPETAKLWNVQRLELRPYVKVINHEILFSWLTQNDTARKK